VAVPYLRRQSERVVFFPRVGLVAARRERVGDGQGVQVVHPRFPGRTVRKIERNIYQVRKTERNIYRVRKIERNLYRVRKMERNKEIPRLPGQPAEDPHFASVVDARGARARFGRSTPTPTPTPTALFGGGHVHFNALHHIPFPLTVLD
jgi:hypothetical protein